VEAAMKPQQELNPQQDPNLEWNQYSTKLHLWKCLADDSTLTILPISRSCFVLLVGMARFWEYSMFWTESILLVLESTRTCANLLRPGVGKFWGRSTFTSR
jgi:hypothetical protein